MKIELALSIPMPEKEQADVHKKPPLMERVKDAITMVDSGHESEHEWEFLRCLNNKLMQKKSLNEKQKKLLKMITPVMKRYKSMTSEEVLQDTDKLVDSDSQFESF